MNGPIVVGTDGSDTASVAVATATTLAKTFHQPLHVMSAYHLQASGGTGLPAEVAVLATPYAWVESLLADEAVRARLAGVDVTTHAKIGNAAEALLDLAEEISASMIVVGNRGIGSKSRFILGNVPSRVVHHAPCSVFVVNTSGVPQ